MVYLLEIIKEVMMMKKMLYTLDVVIKIGINVQNLTVQRDLGAWWYSLSFWGGFGDCRDVFVGVLFSILKVF